MPKSIKRTRPISPPVVLNRDTKEFQGFSIFIDASGSDVASLTATWAVPHKNGTIQRLVRPLDAAPIQAMPGFDAIVDAIVSASE